MLTVLFSCAGCGLEDVEVKVPARSSPEEDVNEWMEGEVLTACQGMHELMSPVCMAHKFEFIKIPIPPGEPNAWIGKQTDNVPPKGKPSCLKEHGDQSSELKCLR